MLALLSMDEIDLTIGEQRILEDLEETGNHTRSFDHLETRHVRRLLNAGYVTTRALGLGTACYDITAAGQVALRKARRRWPSTDPLKGL
jgi:hypothetical protein